MSADQLAAHGLDLFSPLGPGVTARTMFGALGFHASGRFFAIGDVGEGAIYLKVDDVTRGRFEAAGGRPFTYPAKDGRLMVMSYLTPPDAALEDPEAMLPWARLALEAAGRAAARKTGVPRKARSAVTRKAAARVKPAGRAKPPAKATRPPPRARRRPSRPASRRG